MIIIIIIIILLLLIHKSKTSLFGQMNKGTNSSILKGTVALITLMYKPKNVETWLKIHRDLGISHFYIRLENTPELIKYLQSQPDVTLMVADASNDKNQYSSLQDRQNTTVNKVLKMCKNTFLIHIDSDEILEGNLDEIRNLPDSVGTFWMQNYEAVYKDIPTSENNCFEAQHFKNCGDSDSGCVSYVNGKGGARISAKNVHCAGPHRFVSDLEDIKVTMIVKHFESCDFDQYIKKYTRLSKDVNLESIPFPYYRESIMANGDNSILKSIYTKYRVYLPSPTSITT